MTDEQETAASRAAPLPTAGAAGLTVTHPEGGEPAPSLVTSRAPPPGARTAGTALPRRPAPSGPDIVRTVTPPAEAPGLAFRVQALEDRARAGDERIDVLESLMERIMQHLREAEARRLAGDAAPPPSAALGAASGDAAPPAAAP